MPRSPRELTKRAVDPLLAALDRRLETLAARLEGHTSRLADAQREELRRVDERLAVELRVLDEQLLANERAAHAQPETADPLAARLAAAADEAVRDGRAAHIVVVPPGAPLAEVPVGVKVTRAVTFTHTGDGGWVETSGDAADVTRLRVLFGYHER